MSFLIKSQVTNFEATLETVTEILEYLSDEGYIPLINQAKRKFTEVFGGSSKINNEYENVPPELVFDYMYSRALRYQSNEQTRVPIAGDLFYSSDEVSVLYLGLMVSNLASIRRRARETKLETQLEIGFIGNESSQNILTDMAHTISKFLAQQTEQEITWTSVQPTSQPFIDLRQGQDNKFVLANRLTNDELQLSQQLEEQTTRSLALVIKRSGGILASDLTKKSNLEIGQAQKIIDGLSLSGLISKEYVIICKKTSNQVNRVDSKEKIDKMTEMGILCSCGNPIGHERIEELFSPTDLLHKMLNQSYWMTVRLVKSLKEANIPEENILLNLQDGAEEIDAFVDLEGTLLMFELKDNEFSMGHAYPFSGRIGLYKPDIALIVSTKGIGPEVKDYFKRVKPAAEIIYVGSLIQFDDALQKVILETRSSRAKRLISQFEPMANINTRVAQMIATRLGLKGNTSTLDPDDIPF